MKVAIVKNRLDRGGVLSVILRIILALNNIGIVPTIVTFRTKITPENVLANYGLKVSFNIKTISPDIKMPYEWHLLWFNIVTRFYTSEFDFIINSNNTSFLSPKKTRLTYVHYPRKARVLSKWLSIHSEGGEKNSGFIYKTDFLRLAKLLYFFNKRFKKNELVIANSNFTKQAILSSFLIADDKVKVIYPAINFPKREIEYSKKISNQLISLGRFEKNKRQLEQIKIAQKLPQFNFIICGFVNDQNYFNQCQKLVHNLALKNVQLKNNLPYSDIQQLLNKSKYFIHSLRNEPFGITVAEGISFGCIPIVHNSGGQIETVYEPFLRYNHESEIPQIIADLEKKSEEEKIGISRDLINGLLRFSNEQFDLKITNALNLVINEK